MNFVSNQLSAKIEEERKKEWHEKKKKNIKIKKNQNSKGICTNLKKKIKKQQKREAKTQANLMICFLPLTRCLN